MSADSVGTTIHDEPVSVRCVLHGTWTIRIAGQTVAGCDGRRFHDSHGEAVRAALAFVPPHRRPALTA